MNEIFYNFVCCQIVEKNQLNKKKSKYILPFTARQNKVKTNEMKDWIVRVLFTEEFIKYEEPSMNFTLRLIWKNYSIEMY